VPEVRHQTVRLSRGNHASAQEGACVMELASMLADESFTDQPKSACPVIGMVLRSYNDGLDDRRRQDLYAYASAVIGTREPSATRRRLRMCLDHFAIVLPLTRTLVPGARLRAVGAHAFLAGLRATDEVHAEMLDLIERLIAERGDAVAVASLDALPVSTGEREPAPADAITARRSARSASLRSPS
jgi:hypothetical protein